MHRHTLVNCANKTFICDNVTWIHVWHLLFLYRDYGFAQLKQCHIIENNADTLLVDH